MEQMIAVCKNPWCKAHFFYTESEMVLLENNSEKTPPIQCNKCRSFNDELSAGITWSDKKYEGSRMDGLSHPISINVSKYADRKKW